MGDSRSIIGEAAGFAPPRSGDEPVRGYRLIRRRGRGGFAEVWEAEAPGGFRVALKFVRLGSRLRSAEIRALDLIREIRHPNLLATFGSWQADGILIVAMELADCSLSDRFLEAIAQGLRGIPREELLGYLSDAAVGVDHLNSHRHAVDGRQGVGIQHRDLKPQNILLFGGGAKLGDFGLARIMERSVASHTAGWTVSYAAPEVFGGHTSRHSDQYGLAVTYCQLRGGRLPFGGSAAAITAGHLFSTPDLDALPEPERPVVARAMAKHPEERWPDCRSFVAALRAIHDLVPDTLALDEPGFPPCDPESFPIPADLFESDATPLINPSPSWSWGDDATNVRVPDPVLDSMTSWFNPAGLPGTDSSVPADGPAPLPAPETVSDPARGEMTLLPWEGSPGWVFQVSSRLVADENEEGGPEFAASGAGDDSSLTIRATATPPVETETETEAVGPVGERADSSLRGDGSAPVPSDAPLDGRDPVPAPDRSREEVRPNWSPIQFRVHGRIGEDVDPSPGAIGAASGWSRYLVLAVVVLTAVVLVQAPGPPEDRPRADALETPRIDSQAPPVRRVALGPPPGIEAPKPALSSSLSKTSTGAVLSPAPALLHTWEGRLTKPSPLADEDWGGDRGDDGRRVSTGQLEPTSKVSAVASPVLERKSVSRAEIRPPLPDLPNGPEAFTAIAVESPTYTPPLTGPELKAVAPSPPAVASIRAVATRGNDRAEAGMRLQVESDPAGAAFEQGRRHLSARSYHRAVAEFTEVIRLNPAYPDANLSRAVAETLEGRFREALDDYKEAIRLRPEDTRAYLARARTHHDLGNYAEALADYTEAIRLRPDVTAHYGRGLVRYHSGDYAGAIDDFTAVIQLDPNHASSYRYRGDAFARQGRGDRGEADHRTASRLAAGLSHPRTAKSN